MGQGIEEACGHASDCLPRRGGRNPTWPMVEAHGCLGTITAASRTDSGSDTGRRRSAHSRSGLFCQSLEKLVVSGASWSGQLRSGPIAQRWDRHAHAEHATVDTGDDVVVHETIQSMHEV